MLVLLVLYSRRHVTRRSRIPSHHGDGGAGEPGGSPPPETEEIGRALDGEEEGVDEGGDGDDGDEAEDELDRREINGPMRRRVRRRWSIGHGGAGVHGGGEVEGLARLWTWFLIIWSLGRRSAFYYYYLLFFDKIGVLLILFGFVGLLFLLAQTKLILN